MGILVGDCFAMGFLMTLTAKMSHETAFLLTAIISTILLVPLLFMIAEPSLLD
jgi:hypothetical protein